MKSRLQKHVFSQLHGALIGAALMFLISVPLFSTASTLYYRSMPVDTFYVNNGLYHEDVCFGDLIQTVSMNRFAYKTNTGWQIKYIKELFREDGDLLIHIANATQIGDAFVEISKNGTSTRESAIMLLPVGSYHWDTTVTHLYLPEDVVRKDVQTIKGQTFKVKKCE